MTTLVLRLDLSRLGEPSDSELEASGYDSPEDYWRDFFKLRLGEPALRQATITIEDD